MSKDAKHIAPPDFGAVARAHGFAIPDNEVQRLQQVLAPLVEACRASYGTGLSLIEPVGTFRLESTATRD